LNEPHVLSGNLKPDWKNLLSTDIELQPDGSRVTPPYFAAEHLTRAHFFAINGVS
jgi:hypothetical protein